MDSNDMERLEEILSRLAEGAAEEGEREEAERYLAAHPEAATELAFERALVDRLRELPSEQAPADFAPGILSRVPELPGSFLHRLELYLRRLLRPSLSAAAVMAAALVFLIPTSPNQTFESPPAVQVASLVAGPNGLQVGQELLYPDEVRALASGTTIKVPESSSATLVMDENVEVEVRGGSTLRLEPRVVHLAKGSVYCRVEPGIGNFAVEGPLATARVVGTEFEVRAEQGRNTVSVTEGIVEVRSHRGEGNVQVLAGGSATVARSSADTIRTEGPVRRDGEPLKVKEPPRRTPAGAAGPGRSENLPVLDSY